MSSSIVEAAAPPSKSVACIIMIAHPDYKRPYVEHTMYNCASVAEAKRKVRQAWRDLVYENIGCKHNAEIYIKEGYSITAGGFMDHYYSEYYMDNSMFEAYYVDPDTGRWHGVDCDWDGIMATLFTKWLAEKDDVEDSEAEEVDVEHSENSENSEVGEESGDDDAAIEHIEDNAEGREEAKDVIGGV